MAQGGNVSELPYAHVNSLPKPGDLIIARRSLKAWESDLERGADGQFVHDGDAGIVVQVWKVGRQVRIRVLIKDTLLLFSHADHVVWINWSYGEGLETPT